MGEMRRSVKGEDKQTHSYSVRSLVWSREVPRECKKVIYETQCVPILTYASETWTVKGRDVSKIQATEMKFLRSRVTRMIRKRNEEVRVLVKEEPLQERIYKSRLVVVWLHQEDGGLEDSEGNAQDGNRGQQAMRKT